MGAAQGHLIRWLGQSSPEVPRKQINRLFSTVALY